jgi:cytochrome oxidase Cu insertion factor (SCO1/SenC/PrrC family)
VRTAHAILEGGPPGPQPIPWSASSPQHEFCKQAQKAGQGVGRRPGGPPSKHYHALAVAFALAVVVSAAFAQPGQPAPMQPSLSMQDANLKPALPGALMGVGIDQKLDSPLPLDLIFKDEAGRPVPLSSFFQTKKPVILALVYYRCPMLCTQILNGLESSLKAVSFNPGQDFEVLSVSFDPKDTPELAASKMQT